MGSVLEVAALVEIVEEGTSRISSLVNDFKAYSNTDQALLKYVDIHDGLEGTLRVLRYKLREGVDIKRKYDRSLPRIPAYEDELNQVWTNLIDNAIDALDARGTVCIRTERDQDSVVVEVADNGLGIPPEIQA